MTAPDLTSASSRPPAKGRYDAITTGLLMVAAGIALMLHNAGSIDLWALRAWWPLLLLVPAGGALVGDGECGRGWFAALAWTAASVFLLLFMQGYPVLDGRTVFALVLIVVGGRMLWRPGAGPAGPAGGRR
jgi:hypothetical protein